MVKKFLSLALALLSVVGLFAGCSKEDIEDSPDPTPVESTSTSPSPSTTGKVSSEPDEDQTLAVADGGEFKLPLTESKTFSVWVSFSSENMLSLNDSYAYKEFENRTGIHIDWKHVSSASALESFQLAMMSQDYSDSYQASITYLTNGADYYVDNDIIVDLEPYIAQYAPNYNYIRNLTDGTKMATLTDSGMCVAFYKIMQKLQWAYFGPLGRYDWLEDLGLDVPETYDELHDTLVAFRDNYNPEMPLSILPHGIDDWLLAGFDTMYSTSVTGNVFIQKQGVAKFGVTEPGFKEYIQTMADWYDEGLVDRDFYGRDGYPGMDSSLVLNNKIGLGISLYTYPDHFEGLALANGDENLKWRGFKCPVKNPGDTRKVTMGGGQLYYRGNLCAFITTACDDIEFMMKWYDYFYTEQGALLCSYGIENESFVYDDGGNPTFTELVYKNPDGLSLNNAIALYACPPSQASWYNWERELVPTTSENVWNTKELFEGNWEDEYTMPQITLNAEESSEYAKIMNDVMTYLSENVVKFITGQKSMDEYDSMIEQIYSMDIEKATAIQQQALDRFYSRQSK